MKFKIPDSYRIAGVDHRVIVSETIATVEGRRGMSSYFVRECEIASQLSLPEQRRTLLHEALHHIDNLFDTDLKESQVRRLATGIGELIQQLEPEE